MLEMLGSARSKKASFYALFVVAMIALSAVAVITLAGGADSDTITRTEDSVSAYLEHPLAEGKSHFPAARVATARDLGMEVRASAGVGHELAGTYAITVAGSEDLGEDSICLFAAPPAGFAVGGSAMACQTWSMAEKHGLYVVHTDVGGYHVAAFVPGAQQATLEANAEANDDGVGVNRVDRDGSMVEAFGTWDADVMATTSELVISRSDAEPVRIEVFGTETDG